MIGKRAFLAGSAAMTLAGSREVSAGERDGFFVPPEEAPHERTFMQWPVSRRVHPDPVFLKMAQQTIADIANAKASA